MAVATLSRVRQLSCYLSIFFAFAQGLLADDFNRPNVAYTHNGSEIGWYWQASGAGTWSLKNHEIYVQNADASVQEDHQVLYYTRASLQSGDWHASVDVRCDTATRRAGLVFMVGAGGTNHYQIRLKADSREVQVLKRGTTGSQTIYSNTDSSSETFATNEYYSINAWSIVPTQFQWTITNSGGTNVASGFFADADYTNGYAGIIKSVGDPNSDTCHFDNFYVREITVLPITQPRPRLLISPADVVNVKGAINAQVEPRYSTWLNLQYRADIWSQQPVTAPYTGRNSMEFFEAARIAGSRASKMALAYLLNGNTAYAAKAKEILLAWARATPLPATDFDPNFYFSGSGMHVARGIEGLVLTYDYLYDMFSSAERTDVENWFRGVLPTIQQSIQRWNTPFKSSTTDPRGWVESSNLNDIYFGGQLYQNHVVAHNMGYLLIGYALGDQALVQYAVDSKDNPRPYLTLFEGTLLMAGDPYVAPADRMNPPPQDGEIYDRYRHVSPPGLGLNYAWLSLCEMMAMTETLFVNGINLYTRMGAYGETMEQPFSFYADFFRLKDSSIKGGFYTGETFQTNTWPIAVFEVANKRYPGNLVIQTLLNSIDRVTVDPGGYMETYFCYPTLTHGVVASWTGTASTDFEVAGNWEVYVPANDTNTDIAHFDVAPALQPRLTASRSMAGLEFGVSGITLSSLDAQVLTLGPSGISSGGEGMGTNTVSVALSLAANQRWSVLSNNTLVVSGAIAGPFAVIKDGAGMLIVSGTNSYTGDTTLSAGTLSLATASLASTANVSLTNGVVLNLTFTGTNTISGLFINGDRQRAGTWGAIGSGTANTTNLITGTGLLNVTTGPYEFWATANGLDGTLGKESGFAADPDHDGNPNCLEWIFGSNPLAGSLGVSPKISGDANTVTLTFNRTSDSISTTILLAQWGTDLKVWKDVPIGSANSGPDANGVTVTVTKSTGAPDTIAVTIPSTNAISGKLFIRLKTILP